MRASHIFYNLCPFSLIRQIQQLQSFLQHPVTILNKDFIIHSNHCIKGQVRFSFVRFGSVQLGQVSWVRLGQNKNWRELFFYKHTFANSKFDDIKIGMNLTFLDIGMNSTLRTGIHKVVNELIGLWTLQRKDPQFCCKVLN